MNSGRCSRLGADQRHCGNVRSIEATPLEQATGSLSLVKLLTNPDVIVITHKGSFRHETGIHQQVRRYALSERSLRKAGVRLPNNIKLIQLTYQ